MTHRIVSGILASAVADAGTFTASYPARLAPQSGNTNEGDFYGAMGHKLVLNGAVLSFPDDFGITLGTSSITVTNKTGATWAADSEFSLQLEEQGKSLYRTDIPAGTGKTINRAARSDTIIVNLGAPDTADDDGYATNQSTVTDVAMTLNGAAVVSSEGVADTPRNVIITSAGNDAAITFTVTGKDEYGATVVEAITGANATVAAGKKAFAKVTSVTSSANSAGNVKVGFGDVLGLPVFLPSAGHILKEMQDGAAATAGTTVAGISTAGGSTATTGDVRGTYDPNAACDGDKVFQLILSLPDPTFIGIDQYAG